MDLTFRGQVIEWRGPAPFYFVPLPEAAAADVREVAAMATYGWGVVPVTATVDGVAFTTSLFPKDGGYLLPLRSAVRAPRGLDVGDEIEVGLSVQLGR